MFKTCQQEIRCFSLEIVKSTLTQFLYSQFKMWLVTQIQWMLKSKNKLKKLKKTKLRKKRHQNSFSTKNWHQNKMKVVHKHCFKISTNFKLWDIDHKIFPSEATQTPERCQKWIYRNYKITWETCKKYRQIKIHQIRKYRWRIWWIISNRTFKQRGKILILV